MVGFLLWVIFLPLEKGVFHFGWNFLTLPKVLEGFFTPFKGLSKPKGEETNPGHFSFLFWITKVILFPRPEIFLYIPFEEVWYGNSLI